jgi:hypothetical protein
MALFLDVSPGDRVIIGGTIVTVEEKSGRRIRFRIDTHADVKHERAERRAVGEEPLPRLTRPARRTTP